MYTQINDILNFTQFVKEWDEKGDKVFICMIVHQLQSSCIIYYSSLSISKQSLFVSVWGTEVERRVMYKKFMYMYVNTGGVPDQLHCMRIPC